MRKPQRGYARQDRVKEQIMRELAELVVRIAELERRFANMMRHGTVDESWAKAHHAVWYEEVKAGVPPGTFDDRTPPDHPPGSPPPGQAPNAGMPPRPAH